MIVNVQILDRAQRVADSFNLNGNSAEIDAIERFLFLLNTETYDSTTPDIMLNNTLDKNARTLAMPKRRDM